MDLPVASDGTVCAKCDAPSRRTYNCDHTDFEEYCKECYTELHYYLTEPDAAPAQAPGGGALPAGGRDGGT